MERHKYKVLDVALDLVMAARGSCDAPTEDEEAEAVEFLHARLRDWQPSLDQHHEFDESVRRTVIDALAAHARSKVSP